jgi:hypothetical protein
MAGARVALLTLGLLAGGLANREARRIARTLLDPASNVRADYDAIPIEHLWPLDAGSILRGQTHPYLQDVRCEGRGALVLTLLLPGDRAAVTVSDINTGAAPAPNATGANVHEAVGWPFVHPRFLRRGWVLSAAGPTLPPKLAECASSSGFYGEIVSVEATEEAAQPREQPPHTSAHAAGLLPPAVVRVAVAFKLVTAVACFERLSLGVSSVSPAEMANLLASPRVLNQATPASQRGLAAHTGGAAPEARSLLDLGWNVEVPANDISFEWAPTKPTLVSGSGFTVLCDGCRAKAQITFNLKAEFDWFKLLLLEGSAKVAPTARFALSATYDVDYNRAWHWDLLRERLLFTVNLPIVVATVHIPVYGSIGADLSLESSARMAIQNVGFELG